jgi:DNA-binding response OmpR family regulator
MSEISVLVIEDDEALRALVGAALRRAHMDVLRADTGEAGLRALFASTPDVVLLDLGLPTLGGWETLSRIRDLSGVPVIVVSGRTSEIDKVRALRAGADDYMTKPLGLQELVARIEALLRRTGAPVATEAYDDGLVALDFARAAVRVGGRPVALTPREYRLLVAFVRHPDRVLSKEELLELAWGEPPVGLERIRLYVSYLRAKFRAAGAELPVSNARGFGYVYTPRRGPRDPSLGGA